MGKRQRQFHKKPEPGLGPDLIAAALLLMVALGVRWLFVQAVVYPPLDDPAFYLTTAENLVTGRGLEVDVLWSYQDPSLGVTHPSHEHWMPVTTGLVAVAFALEHTVFHVVEPTLHAGQLPGMILGALLAPLTYIIGRRILPGGKKNRWVALGAGLLIAANASLSYQSASADSSAPFAFLAAWALLTAVRRPEDHGGYLGTGLLITLAYLTRADGLLLLPAVLLAWWLLPMPAQPVVPLPNNPVAQQAWHLWPREPGSKQDWRRQMSPTLVDALELVVAFLLLVAPWLLRNYLAFGTPLPSSLLNQAWLSDYIDTFNYSSHPTWQSMMATGWHTFLAVRVQSAQHDAGVLLLSTFPWGLLALPGFWLLRDRRGFYPPLVYGSILFFVMAIVFPISSQSGTLYHSLGGVMPFLAVAAMYTVQRAAQRLAESRRLAGPVLAAVTAGLLALVVAQSAVALPGVSERHQAEKEQFQMVARWLAEHANSNEVVMTTQPYTVNYASGHPSIALPGNEPPDAAWEAAQRYGARFLVITQSFGYYPQILHDQPDARFRLLESVEGTEFFEIEGAQP
jgi:hypothetical protein